MACDACKHSASQLYLAVIWNGQDLKLWFDWPIPTSKLCICDILPPVHLVFPDLTMKFWNCLVFVVRAGLHCCAVKPTPTCCHQPCSTSFAFLCNSVFQIPACLFAFRWPDIPHPIVASPELFTNDVSTELHKDYPCKKSLEFPLWQKYLVTDADWIHVKERGKRSPNSEIGLQTETLLPVGHLNPWLYLAHATGLLLLCIFWVLPE